MGMVEDLVMRLENGVATKEDIQQLRDVGWLTPSLEKLHRVDIYRCSQYKSVFRDVDGNPLSDFEPPAWMQILLMHEPKLRITVISDGAYLIQTDREESTYGRTGFEKL